MEKGISPWFIEPVWQNISSMHREAVTASEATTGMERAHHLTAALYFGVAALEAFLNRQARTDGHAFGGDAAQAKSIRQTRIMEKVRDWPRLLLGRDLDLSDDLVERIGVLNEMRGDLTHAKTTGHVEYDRLNTLSPRDIVLTISEYIAQYHKAKGDRFEYWLWGWNYLNPRPDEHEIILVNTTQFLFSLRSMGVKVPGPDFNGIEKFRREYMSDFTGFMNVLVTLDKLSRCEPKFAPFPFQPKLCGRWWTPEHHRTCGNVTKGAIERAR